MHREEERGEKDICSSTCTRTQMLSRGFQIPYLLRNSGYVTMLRNYMTAGSRNTNWDRAHLFGGCPYRGGGGRDVHGEGERGEKDICSSYMYTYADAVTWFPDPILVAEFRIRHYAAELHDSGIQKYKLGSCTSLWGLSL